MTTCFYRVFLLLGIVHVLTGCAGHQPVRDPSPFKAVDLNSRIKSGDYVQKVDHFLVILDASGTTKGAKYQEARRLAKNMNLTIPNLRAKGGAQGFWQGWRSNRSRLRDG